MGWRQRNGFDGINVPREDQNLTKYDQKYTLPTDASNVGYNTAPSPEPMYSGAVQNQAPAPDPNEQSFVFGGAQQSDGRASVFGGAQQPDGRTSVFGGAQQPAAVQQSMFGGTQQAAGQNAFAGLNNNNGFNMAPIDGVNSAPVGGGYAAPSTVQNECPMVFALRAKADMFVYEYSDRLEYFRRTDIGMVHCYTVNKVKKY